MLPISFIQSRIAPSRPLVPMIPTGKELYYQGPFLPVKKYSLSRNIQQFPYGEQSGRVGNHDMRLRLCDVDTVKNNLPYQSSKNLFKQLTVAQTGQTSSLSKQPHVDALKQVILAGTQLLLEVERLSRFPSNIPNATSIRPASLVVYQEKPNANPKILKKLPLLEHKPLSDWPFRLIANGTKELAAKESSFIALNAFMQFLASLDDLSRVRPIKSVRETAHFLENTLHGARQLKFSKVETHRMQQVAKLYGYENDLTAYLSETYQLIQDTQATLKQEEQQHGTPAIKLGILYYNPESPNTQKIQDVSALFPACDFKVFLSPSEQLRDRLEELYYLA